MSAVTLLFNGRIRTLGAETGVVEAIAIGQDGRVLAVGTREQLDGLVTAGTRRVDLGGKWVTPGFFDCHQHPLWLGLNLGQVSLASPPVADVEDIVRLLRERRAAQPDAVCIQGVNYDQNKLAGRVHPTRYDLDRVAADIPVRIEHTSGHASVVNSRALELLGYGRDAVPPVGGEIERGEDGEPTGLLLETAAWEDQEKIVPAATREEGIEALGRANQYLLERGITSVSDAETQPQEVEFFQHAVWREALRVRANSMIDWAELMDGPEDEDVPTPDEMQPEGYDWHRYHVGQAKLFADGAITTRTCWLRAPFANSDSLGIPIHSPEALRGYVRQAHNQGWQIATHAIGDRAIDEVLIAYALAQRDHTRRLPGHRVEHCMLLDSDLIGRMRRQKIWSIGQPEFLTGLGEAYVAALGEERAALLSPYATLEIAGVAQAFSSDAPVVPGAPLDGLRAARERRTLGGRVLGTGEILDGETALFNYTTAPAFATRTAADRGTLEPRKWADLVVLSADPVATPLDEWESVCVVATMVGGEFLVGGEALE